MLRKVNGGEWGVVEGYSCELLNDNSDSFGD